MEKCVISKTKHKVFISYHHKNDQWYKNYLVDDMNGDNKIFIDCSVDTGDIDDSLPAETIRRKIRDEYLRDSSVTILLVGKSTWSRKHIDWELHSSMIDGPINKKSGILIILLPSVQGNCFLAPHSEMEKSIYPNATWGGFGREQYEEKFGCLPRIILDNIKQGVPISITRWSDIADKPAVLKYLIDVAFQDKEACNYILSRPMLKKNLIEE